LELRIKDLLSQVAKYDKELALINHEKNLQLEMIKADSHKSEQSKLDLSSNERNTINRRKRKRYEDYTDTLLYIKKHHIFSYYNHGLTSYPFSFYRATNILFRTSLLLILDNDKALIIPMITLCRKQKG
jgi:hypothetical protein